MRKNVKRVNISPKSEPIAKKVKKTIQEGVLGASRDTRVKNFPQHLPASNYVTIKPKNFKKMLYKK